MLVCSARAASGPRRAAAAWGAQRQPGRQLGRQAGLCRPFAAQPSSRRRSLTAAAAADDSGSGAGGQPQPAKDEFPPAWEKVQRISSDALTMLYDGEPFTSEIILTKGISELQAEHPGDPATALLHTQLHNILMEAARYDDALQQAEAAYRLMESHFGEDSADAAFHGIRLGISLIAGNKDMERAKELLAYGGSCAAHNLEIFATRMKERQAAGFDTEELEGFSQKLLVALGECNFYGAVGVVRKALLDADELDMPMAELEEAWQVGVRQMAMALPPDHHYFSLALREMGRLIPDAAGRPGLQEELEAAVLKIRELLYLIKQVPQEGAEPGAAPAADEQQGAASDDAYLP